jgi:hypothetical protein
MKYLLIVNRSEVFHYVLVCKAGCPQCCEVLLPPWPDLLPYIPYHNIVKGKQSATLYTHMAMS